MIILIDGDILARQIAADALQVLYNVVQCGSFYEAAERMKQGVDPDCIVLDVNLPCVKGKDAIIAVRTVASEVPLVALCTEDDKLPVVVYGATDTMRRVLSEDVTWAEDLRLKVVRAIEERAAKRRFATARNIQEYVEESAKALKEMVEVNPTESWKSWKADSDPADVKAKAH